MTARALLRQAALFLIIWAAGLAAVQIGRRFADFNAPFFWPMSIFKPRWPQPTQWLALVAAGGLGLAALRLAVWRRGPLATVLAGSLLVLVATLGQGWEGGFARPVAGLWGKHPAPVQYYHDALALTGPSEALRGFNALQPTLNDHARTHPPGALLTYWLLARWLEAPALIGFVLGVVCLLVAGLLLHLWLRRLLTPAQAALGLWLFFLLPAVQIYFVSSLDALIAVCLLGCLAAFAPERGWLHLLPALVCLLLAAWLSFAFVVVLPVLAWVELRARRSVARTAALTAAALLLLTMLKPLLGLDYWLALRTAARIENPEGWRLVAEPISYFTTRVEDVAEILLFLGPFAIALAWQGWRQSTGAWREWTRAALLSLGLLFLTGAFRTGETARACLFLLPLLLLPLAAAPALSEDRAVQILSLLLLAQALAMQALGNYFW